MKAIGARNFVVSAQIEEGEGWPFSMPALRGVESIEFRRPVTFFIGENGTGKSTLLESIAVAAGFNLEGGSKNFQFETVRREVAYEETEHFRVMRDFLNHRAAMLRELMR